MSNVGYIILEKICFDDDVIVAQIASSGSST